jgi:hypothetical protein
MRADTVGPASPKRRLVGSPLLEKNTALFIEENETESGMEHTWRFVRQIPGNGSKWSPVRVNRLD